MSIGRKLLPTNVSKSVETLLEQCMSRYMSTRRTTRQENQIVSIAANLSSPTLGSTLHRLKKVPYYWTSKTVDDKNQGIKTKSHAPLHVRLQSASSCKYFAFFFSFCFSFIVCLLRLVLTASLSRWRSGS